MGWLLRKCEIPTAVANGIFSFHSQATRSRLPDMLSSSVDLSGTLKIHTQSSHYSSPCPKHWTRPSVYSSAQERIIGIPQATSQKTKIPHDRIQLYILPIRNPSPGTYLTELAIDISRPAGNRTMDQEIAIFWGFQNVLFTLHPLS